MSVNASIGEMHALLDSWRYLGMSYAQTWRRPLAKYFHINLEIEWDFVKATKTSERDWVHGGDQIVRFEREPKSRKQTVYWIPGGSLYDELKLVEPKEHLKLSRPAQLKDGVSYAQGETYSTKEEFDALQQKIENDTKRYNQYTYTFKIKDKLDPYMRDESK